METAPVHIEDVATIPPIDRHEMVELARTEYERLTAVLRELDDEAWARPTVCDGWRVREMVAHLLGEAEANASMRENLHQLRRGRTLAAGRPLVDGINDVQVDERRHLRNAELVDRLEAIAARAVRGRRRTPAPLRRVRVPGPLGAPITLGTLVDIVYTRDQWMHRIDIARATGHTPLLTAEHDGRIVADVVRDWAATHAEPVDLQLTGPAGGRYRSGAGGQTLHLDAVDFCLAVSGRTPRDGLLAVPVVF